MTPSSYHLWPVVTALALLGCGGEDGDRPAPEDDGIPGPSLEDPGSGPFRCDQGAELEFDPIESFETGAAHGNWFTNNEVCEICQWHIDLRVGKYNQGASLDRAEYARSQLSRDLDDDDLRAELRVELERIVAEMQRWLDKPKLDLYHPFYRELKASLKEYLAGDLESDDLNNIEETLSDAVLFLADAMEPCRAACEVTQSPTPVFSKPVLATRVPGGRCESVYALNVMAGPLTDWGGTIGATFGPPIDGTQWDGISFWARVGAGSRTPIRIEVADKHTHEKYDEGDGPICNPDHTDDTVRTGCDKFGINMQLGGNWKLYTVPFDELRQKGWGQRAPFFDVAGLYALSFVFERGEWNIWIDDVSLYRRRQP